MDSESVASALVYLGTGVLSTMTQQILVYQGAGTPRAMLIPFFNYLGMALVEYWPRRCGGLPDGAAKGGKPVPRRRRDEGESATPNPVALTSDSMTLVDRQPHSNAALTAAVAAGAPESHQSAVSPAEDSEGMSAPIVLCPAGSTTGVCLPRSVALRLASPLPSWWVIGASVVLDLSGFTLSTIGLALAGSGVYQVVHASVVVFSALFAWLLRGREIKAAQWGAIGMITLGLVVSALGATSNSGSGISGGIVATLAGSIMYGLNYSLLDALSSSSSSPPQAQLASALGSWAASIVALWLLGYTFPHWEELVVLPGQAVHGSVAVVVVALIVVAVSALAHSLAYFRLLRGHGAVAIGVLQALRAAAVFIVGSVLFCSYQQSQCMTMPRATAVAMVAMGVVLFGWFKRTAQTAPVKTDA
jgi:drug/metabolite transporter (DMT)-like permease